ncbi:uncharacterized protein LOC133710904 isoform X3 [Rosa rugosa]|uniref:uncharacterized protein LOC133710904 isoform X3 n=1 Tax=Rosa rugosa TaxID=74645 RepID=UPI002B4163B0|nr:uncharacterized protein LOC133710904 isoform X3 [Rosa rugosa]
MEKEKEFSSQVAELEEAINVLDSSLSLIKWRLKYSSRRRLEIDILALCTGMRPVIMVDYGGKMPELQERLCNLLKLCRKMIKQAEKHQLGVQLISIQKLFSLNFPAGGMKDDTSSSHSIDMVDSKPARNELISSHSSEIIDFSTCMQDTQVTLPTLNGWLLGYPVVYLFSKEHVADAVYNLSMKYLHIYTISVCRNGTPNKQSELEELLSFSVPYGLSIRGSKEEWAEASLAHLQEKWERCKNAWRSLQLEVSELNPQAIVL